MQLPVLAEISPLTLGVLLAVLAAVGLWGGVVYRRTEYTLAQAPLYLVNLLLTRVLWRATVHGRLPLAASEGAVIVSNHISGVDPLFIALATNRPVHWMVAKEYYNHWAARWAFRILQAIPVSRGGVDTAATKLAIRYAAEGELVGVFPEGKINMTDALLLPGRPGAALIALKARVPVIPCYVEGSPYDGTAFGSFLMTAKTTVRIGERIDLSPYYDKLHDRDVQEELTRRFLLEIARLAGVEAYEPKIAGRHWKTQET
jgi:1-acyl-sn-glycerol-3-phosphate acyltransferase